MSKIIRQTVGLQVSDTFIGLEAYYNDDSKTLIHTVSIGIILQVTGTGVQRERRSVALPRQVVITDYGQIVSGGRGHILVLTDIIIVEVLKDRTNFKGKRGTEIVSGTHHVETKV